ncbi:MAG: hypothetical protein HJJLKODD_01221 [Phycisphaerae bacterium]|nr:hypothetical protein [Phycisphaerae bacterium]
MSDSPASMSIIPCAAEQTAALRRFIDEHWRRGHILSRDEELLRWQYDPRRFDREPFTGPTVLLAWEEQKIVGMQAMIPVRFNLLGRVVAGVWLSNLLGIPQARSKGVGLKLLWAVRALKLDAVFDLGINDTVQKLFAGLGYEIIEELPRWVAVLQAEKMTRLMMDTNPHHDLAAVVRRVQEMYTPPSRRVEAGDLILEPLPNCFDEAWEVFWRSILAPVLIGTDRGYDYLNWRYISHPRYRYEGVVVRRAQQYQGLAIWRIEQIRERPEQVMRLVEFLATNESAGVLAAAVRRAADEQRVVYADYYCSSLRLASPLEQVGFHRMIAAADQPAIPTRLQPLEGGHFRMTGALRLSKTVQVEMGPLVGRPELYITKSDGDMDRPN